MSDPTNASPSSCLRRGEAQSLLRTRPTADPPHLSATDGRLVERTNQISPLVGCSATPFGRPGKLFGRRKPSHSPRLR